MQNTMKVFEGSSINADSIKIIVANDETTLFDQTYYYGYSVSYKKEFATKNKPLDKDLIASKAEEFGVEPKDIKYAKGINVFQQKVAHS